MEKISNYSPLAIVVALSIKAVALSISFSDAAVAVSLVGLLALREHLNKHKQMQELAKETAEKLTEMKNAVNAQNSVIAAQAAEFDKLRSTMTGIKIAFGQKDSVIPNTRKIG